MSSMATDGVALPQARVPRRAIAAAVSLGCAAAAVLIRRHAALPFPAFVGACQRLRASGLPVTSRDFFCLPTPGSVRLSYDAALLLVAAALVLPCAILAAAGRRWTSLLPLAVAPFVGVSGSVGTSWWNAAAGLPGTALVAINLVTLGAPVMAIWLVRPRRIPGPRPHMIPASLAFVGCALATAGVSVLAQRILAEHWGEVYGEVSVRPFATSAVAIALFGMVLGTDRRWWPWSFVPVALLLSLAPASALVRSPEGAIDRSMFGVVLPLVSVGLIWSVWRTAAAWLSRRFHLEPIVDDASARRPVAPPRSSRSSLVLNASAVGVAVISMIVFQGDPLPTQIATALPTYLGERIQAQDVRTKLDLRRAIADMDAYAARTGTYRGFDARAGELADPALAWSDGAAAASALTVAIAAATGRTARVAAQSDSGGAFCVERLPGGELRYGGAAGDGTGGTTTLDRAIARCGSTPWSAAAVRRLDPSTMCDGLDPHGGYLICRMVQVLIAQTMARTKPV